MSNLYYPRLASEYSYYLLWGYCYTRLVEIHGREHCLLRSKGRPLFSGHLFEAVHAISARVLDPACCGEVVHVCLHTPLWHISKGTAAPSHRSGYGDMSIPGPLRARIVPTADSPGSDLPDVLPSLL